MTKSKQTKQACTEPTPGPVIIRRPYSERQRVHPKTDPNEPSRTKQSFKDECDINNIMNRYIKTGEISHLNSTNPEYGFAPDFDFSEAMEMVQRAQDLFDELPANIRERFDNDPGEFMAFCEDPANGPEAAALGLTGTPEQRVDNPNKGKPRTPTAPLERPITPENGDTGSDDGS